MANAGKGSERRSKNTKYFMRNRTLALNGPGFKGRNPRMIQTFLKAKLHRATVTEANLDYEGSITIDRNLLEASGIMIHERVEVYDVTNGNRFSTYAIEGPRGSGVICINGAAAHLCKPGNLVIICAYVGLSPDEIKSHQPKVVLLDRKNQVKPAAGEL
jgi:aspartate 1-decarboxylase